MIVRDDLPPTPDWTFTKRDDNPRPSLAMPLTWPGDQA